MLSTPLTKNLLHTTDNYIKSLNKGGILSVGDLLNFLPKTIDDRTNVLESFSLINIKEKNTILVKLISVDNSRTSGGKILTKAIFEDKNGFMSEGVWFNRNYLATQLNKFIGKKVILSGKVKYEYGKLSFISPEIETDLSKSAGEILPIYSDFNYIPGTWIGSKMYNLRNYIKLISETLPENIIKKYNFISRAQAIEKLHFPTSKHDFELARERLAYDELFEINYKSISKKIDKQNMSEGKSISIPLNSDLVKEVISKLPFELTNHQKISLFQILKDMEKTHSMQRLLQGDVGTGKTIIAAIAIIHSVLESSKIGVKIQACLMAPTEILARQHFDGLEKLFTSYGLNSALLVGGTTKKQKDIIKEQLKSGNIDIIIGTHALLEEDVLFNKLGFVIIDEQHRFGVKQREILEKYASKGIFPHSLNMTATPIPRTLALTLYGDQDLSIINEYPVGRKTIFTKVAKNDEDRHGIELFVRNQIESGRQIFWISPLVEESEKIDLANAISTYESLTEIFSPFKVGLLHGKMKPKEKEEIMRAFSNNEIQILSSTSVVEVGVNIPNATIMCIEGAERFGLSQLHQFRGRVGRGEYQSYCYLFPTSGKPTDRLKAMEKTNDGFELAEVDLELRGPGEVYGVRQSGVPEFRIADIKDLELISQIREDIEDLFKK
ncbi:MAG: ATP-dependent DNA helicase RecG [Candidatus Gracilibacteria bacterium]|nr:ATP-dependent DNA helicase RecG [Candidatus Gracilibacteria bacterium]